MNFTAQSKRGFTLIELLIVVTIIAILAVTVFVALNPAQRLSDTKDARRSTDVDTILTAIHQSVIDNKGTLPSNLTLGGAEKQLGTGASGCDIDTGGCSVAGASDCTNLLTGTQNLSKYLASMPVDPAGGTTYTSVKTGYSAVVNSDGIVTVKACGAEGSTISASR